MKQSFPQLAVLVCACLSLVTLVFFPAPGNYLQAVDFWDFQILQCGTTTIFFFLSVGYFSRGKGNNFLKIHMNVKKSSM